MNNIEYIKVILYSKTQNKIIKKSRKLRMVDLFAGTGGFTIAFSKKVKVVMANDFCKKSKEIYEHNFPNHKFIDYNLNDIDVNSIPEHDILTGGFPCQPFSIAGMQKGFKDKRANVFFKILEIIDNKRPRFVVLENVKNILTHDKKKTFDIIQKKIKELGYYIKFEVLNTSFITKIPQNRERIYIICFRYLDDYNKFDFNYKKQKLDNISKYLDKNVDKTLYYTDKVKIWDKLKNDVTKNINTNTVYQYRRYYVRENKNGLCPTLTANMGTGGHNVPIIKDNKGIRKLSPRECFNLQGFPESYEFKSKMSNCSLYKLAGNAISITVAEKIADRIFDICYN
jgi:DNA (cytosine-5)-methyltransferase 1